MRVCGCHRRNFACCLAGGSFVQGRIVKVAVSVAQDLAIYLETNQTFCFFGQYSSTSTRGSKKSGLPPLRGAEFVWELSRIRKFE